MLIGSVQIKEYYSEISKPEDVKPNQNELSIESLYNVDTRT